MLLDTGAVVSVASEQIYKKYLSHLPLREARNLRSYSWEKLKLLGEITVTVQYGEQKYNLPLVIVAGNNPALLGRSWLKNIKLDWGEIFSAVP